MKRHNIHENFSHEETNTPGSERSFGIVTAVALALLTLLNWWHNGHIWHWMGGIAALFLAAAYLFPTFLKPLNWVWFKFGMLLHAVVNPIVMGLLFYGTVL